MSVVAGIKHIHHYTQHPAAFKVPEGQFPNLYSHFQFLAKSLSQM
jgi:hypothetical protein